MSGDRGSLHRAKSVISILPSKSFAHQPAKLGTQATVTKKEAINCQLCQLRELILKRSWGGKCNGTIKRVPNYGFDGKFSITCHMQWQA
jgi:hypothetical protein